MILNGLSNDWTTLLKGYNMELSVVIPTYNRKSVLLTLLGTINNQSYPIHEVIVVDSGTDRLTAAELNSFKNITIRYIGSPASVCMQRNTGIAMAKTPWVFLCDDDLEVPANYLSVLMTHALAHPDAGAMSGLVLQKDTGEWMEQFPVTSAIKLWIQFIFQLSIWGEIKCKGFFVNSIKQYYRKKGNHLSRAGWPVITEFSGDYFRTPVYGLGASVVKRSWLVNSPYEEVLDPHGIGDNYGVATGFPSEGIHVVRDAYVYHHKVVQNRLQAPVQYYRRGLALDYFLQTKKELRHINRGWFLWSLLGNFILLYRNGTMVRANLKLFVKILSGKNPYILGKRAGSKAVTPQL
jgi:glycosyltransferase involved in cell wall biosynthesis